MSQPGSNSNSRHEQNSHDLDSSTPPAVLHLLSQLEDQLQKDVSPTLYQSSPYEDSRGLQLSADEEFMRSLDQLEDLLEEDLIAATNKHLQAADIFSGADIVSNIADDIASN